MLKIKRNKKISEEWLKCDDFEYSKDYITNLQQDNITLTKNLISSNSDHFRKIYKLEKENEELKQTLHNITINDVEEENTTVLDLIKENEKLKNFITNLISELNHCELNRTKKLDIVSDYIKQEYEKVLNGSDEK